MNKSDITTCYGCCYYYLTKEEYEMKSKQAQRHCSYLSTTDCPRFNGGDIKHGIVISLNLFAEYDKFK